MEYSQNNKYSCKPKGYGTRHTLAILGCWAFVISYAMRFNISMAIVAMVNNTNKVEHKPIFKSDLCPYQDNRSNHLWSHENNPEVNILSRSEIFDWDEEDQGLILGSFFWGYIFSQLPGGYLGQRFGGKWPMGVGLLIASIFAIFTPLAAHAGKGYLMAVRIIQGLGEGVSVPAMHSILSKWIPPEERGKLSAFVYAGMPLGTALSMLISGQIIHYSGWPMVFYSSGIVGIIWFISWAYFAYSSPIEHPKISQEELKYIQQFRGFELQQTSEVILRVPWKKVLTSFPFWGIIICQTTETWGLYTVMIELPTYMSTVLHFDMKQNSVMSAFPHLLTWGVSIILTQVGDFMIEKKIVSIVTSRRICNTIALWGSAFGIIVVAYSGCSRVITVEVLGLSVAALGGVYGGVLINLMDIAPNFAGILMGISNTLATIPGFLAPWLAGVILKDNPSLENWRLVFLITAGMSFTGNLVFLMLASGSVQSWNQPEPKKLCVADITVVVDNTKQARREI